MEHVSTKPIRNLDEALSLQLGSQRLLGYSFLRTSLASFLMEKASFYKWMRGIWDPYNHGIGPIPKEASMIGGKPLPIHGDPEPNHSTLFDDSFRSLLESKFHHLFFKKHPLISLVRVKHRDRAPFGVPSSVDFSHWCVG